MIATPHPRPRKLHTRKFGNVHLFVCALLAGLCLIANVRADEPLEEVRIKVGPANVVNETDIGDPTGMVDEQDQIIGAPAGDPRAGWQINSSQNTKYPFSAYIDLGSDRNLSKLYIYDTNSSGKLTISIGKPGDWRELTTYDCGTYRKWVPIQMDCTTRYVRFTRQEPSAIFGEVAFYEYTPEAHKAMLAQKAAEAKAEAERQAAIAKAKAEMAKRPLVDLGEPFGKVYLIDEIDCSKAQPDREYLESPAGASEVQTILGKPCRVLKKTPGETAFISYRMGKMKLLKAGMMYVLEVEYPEDKPRSVIVRNSANEATRGFHTGMTLGDAAFPKYVNNLNEGVATPLSGKYETWTGMFHLHDNTNNHAYIRGKNNTRDLHPADGFTVTIAQFAAHDIPGSAGAAVSRIRLYAVPEPEELTAKYTLPEGLPKRHLFWREEMADGVVGGDTPGLDNPIDWWGFKRNRMKFLGMNTYSKDLLEFGACQHWDSGEYGGNKWVYHDGKSKGYWAQIVKMMGDEGFDVLPYYEYTGSKGQQGLGNKKRARPLTRADAYTHIKWVQSHSVDLTDPDAYEDFKKMLDLTIIRHKDKAKFVGAWIRQRGGMPMSFADATLERFINEANGGRKITRENLIADKALLAKYKDWWYLKRRDFFIAMRDHLRNAGIDDAQILYTAASGEPGVAFPDWGAPMVTDNPRAWKPIFNNPANQKDGKALKSISIDEVVRRHWYLEALQAEPLNWGDWEVNHGAPPSDPKNYHDVEGVMLSHAFNRLYTVSDPATFDAFRTPTGLSIVRHFSLNENMAFDKNDKPKLGYFVVDYEKAGPYSMMAEAVAMANGDPTQIGYLSGSNYTRGFPKYVRSFNTAFLSLPALPSKIVTGAASDREVVVRRIDTNGKGTYFAVVNIGMGAKNNVTVRLPARGTITDAATGEAIDAAGSTIKLSMHPYQLRAMLVK